MRIKAKLALLISGSIIVLSLMLGFISSHLTEKYLLEQVHVRLHESSSKIAEVINQFLVERQETINRLAVHKTLSLYFTEPGSVDLMEIEDLLLLMKNQFHELVLINEQGVEVAKVRGGRISLPLKNHGGTDFFQELKENGARYFSPKEVGNDGKRVRFSSRVNNIYEEPAGVLTGTISADNLHDKVGEFFLSGQIDSYILDSSGTVICSTITCSANSTGWQKRGMNYTDHAGFIRDYAAEEYGSGPDQTITINGIDWLVEHVRLADKSDWYVVSFVDRARFEKNIIILKKMFVVITLAVIFAGVLLAFYAANSISKPIQLLVKMTDRISKGDFVTRINIKSEDEIGELAGSFTHMLAELKKTTEQKDNEILDHKKTTDILRKSEEELKRSKKISETTLNSMNDAICLINTHDHSIVDANKAFCEQYGVSKENIVGKPCYEITHQLQEPLDICPLKETVSEGRIAHAEYFHSLEDGSEVFAEIITSPIMDENGQVSQVVHIERDITKRKQAEKNLKMALESEKERSMELRQAYLRLEEEEKERELAVEEAAVMEERSRLARELHDSVTQSLYSLTLFAETGRELMMSKEYERLEKCLQELSQNAQATLKEMRLLVYDLRPLVLEEEGLLTALQQRLDTVEQRAGVKGQLIVESDGKLSPQAEGGLYRIAQEALNNSLKHSRATSVTISIRIEPDWAEFEVSDNGVGFDLEDVKAKGGLGLSNIRERAEKLGGTMKVQSSPGNGTKIQVRIKREQGELNNLTVGPQSPG